MTKLQQVVKHEFDCSCYQVILGEYGHVEECKICDCGALRKAVKEKNVSDDIYDCWTQHINAIQRS